MLGVLALSCTSPLFAQGSVLPVKSQRMRSQIDAGQAIALDGDWSVLPLPVDFTSASDVHTRGTSLYMQTPSHVYLWSAITRSWTTVAVSPTAVVTQYNAFVTIEDGNTVHAYGTRRGTVETLTFASPPQIFSGSPSSCWMAVVVSGTDAWSFGAFDGEFHHADLNAAVSTIVVGQTVALIEDGTRVLACSAYYGELKAVDLPTGATLDANGDTAVVWSPDQVHCFSAHLDTWTTRNTSGATAIDVQRGFALFGEGNDLIAYSPCTGDFATLTPPAGFQYEPGRYVAAVHAGTELWAYSSGQNRFVARTLAGAANLQISDEVLVVEDGTETVAFSVTSGAFSDALPGSFTASTNAAMVWAQDGSQGRALDIVHGTWSSPVSLAGNPSIQVLRNLVVLVESWGYRALSGRGGDWQDLVVSTPGQFRAPTSGDIFVVLDAGRAVAYDPILDRWNASPHATQIQQDDIWRVVYVGFDGSRVHGYSMLSNSWSSRAIEGNLLALDANSASGFVLTDSHLYAYSPHGSLSTLSRFPEFSRLQPIGAPLTLLQTAPAGSQVFMTFGTRATWMPFQPGGTVVVDPTSVVREFFAGSVPASGLLRLDLDLSGAAGLLQGSALHVQSRILEPSGRTWLSNGCVPILL